MRDYRQKILLNFYQIVCTSLFLSVLYSNCAPVAARNYGANKVAPNSPQQVITGPARILDGDTLIINRVHIRLFGIDAPEMDQFCKAPHNPHWRCGLAARKALVTATLQQIVTCRGRAIDDYQRLVAVCFISSDGGRNIELNRLMVAEGWAMAYRRYAKLYVADEEAAHAAKLGLWASQFMMPWAWRHRQNKPRH